MICQNCQRDKGDVVVCPYCHVGKVEPFKPHHLPAGTIIGGRYEIRAVLGEGGFGITYLACDIKLDKKVALKEYFPHGFSYRNSTAQNSGEVIVSGDAAVFEHGMKRFLSEAKTLGKFSGQPGIVEVSDYLEENHTAYLVMEYLDGTTLRDYLEKNGKMAAEDAFVRLKPVINTLELIHGSGVIHRDISPDNIMILHNGGLKLMDFGSAKEYIDSERSMSVLLKSGYAPEEQYRRGGDQGPWTDVYALCATVYRCITGKTPVDALNRLIEDTLKKPSQLGISILPALEDVLMYGLAVRKRDRCQSMGELRDLINKAIRPAAKGPQPAATKGNPYETVQADDDYAYSQKAERQKREEQQRREEQRRREEQQKREEQRVASRPSSAASAEVSEEKKINDRLEAWASILVFAGLIGVIIALMNNGKCSSGVQKTLMIGTPIVILIAAASIHNYIEKPHSVGYRPFLTFALFLLTVWFCVFGYLLYNVIFGDASFLGKTNESSTSVSSSQVNSKKISVEESDNNAKDFQSTIDYLFSFVDADHYSFPSYFYGKTYQKSGKYYSTDLENNEQSEFDLPSSVRVGSMTISLNETTLKDVLDRGWSLNENDVLKSNSYSSQFVRVEKDENSISLSFDATPDDVNQAKITGVTLFESSFTDGGGEFYYGGLTMDSTIRDTLDKLGEPSELFVFDKGIELRYDPDDSVVDTTVKFEYDRSADSAPLYSISLRYVL